MLCNRTNEKYCVALFLFLIEGCMQDLSILKNKIKIEIKQTSVTLLCEMLREATDIL